MKTILLQIAAIMIGLIAFISCNKQLVTPSSSVTDISSRDTVPYLMLISLDGFRWDYVDTYQPPNLLSFIENGVKASSLIPSYPSKTFPNHYTIATGMYPDNHGLLANVFYKHDMDTIFDIGNRDMAEDGRFYGGSPIWVEAHKANIKTASYFFVGTEAEIQGVRPDYYYLFNSRVKNEDRVKQALDWLNMEEPARPHFITMYFGDLDKVGHRYGPDDREQLQQAVLDMDKVLGELFKGIADIGLPVNIIIVSDHGMANQATEQLIPIESIKNDGLFKTINSGTIVNIHPRKSITTDSVLNYLKQKEDHFKVYTTTNTPGFETTPTNPDWGALQLIPDDGYYFLEQDRKASLLDNDIMTIGVHGYDSKIKDMHGIFYANGPALKSGYEIASFKNIHIYPLMCKILGINIPEGIDGDIQPIKSVLRN